MLKKLPCLTLSMFQFKDPSERDKCIVAKFQPDHACPWNSKKTTFQNTKTAIDAVHEEFIQLHFGFY